MHITHALSRAWTTVGVLAVTGLLGFAGLAVTGAQAASATSLFVQSLTATDGFGNTASNINVWTTEAVTLKVTASENVGSDTLRIVNVNAPDTALVSCTQVQACAPVEVDFSTAGQQLFVGQLLSGGQVVSTFDAFVTWGDFGVTPPAGRAAAARTVRPAWRRPLDRYRPARR
jgi:hypothetical protein